LGQLFISFLSQLILANLVFFLYFACLGIYFALLIVSGIWVLIKSKSLLMAFLVVPTILITHIFYGLMFFRGITKKVVKSKYSREKI